MSHLPDIIFMGTPDFAVPALRALVQAGYPVRLVLTQPDRPKGRGRRPAPPPVKIAALQADLEVIQPPTVRSAEVIERLHEIAPAFMVVTAYGQILPETVLAIPHLGAINIHGSLLPKYRGPAPVQWAMLRGESRTGVCTMLMDRGIDTGDIFLSSETDINASDTADSLLERLALMGAGLLLETLQGVAAGTLRPVAQNHAMATYAPLLRKQDGRIDWSRSASELDRFIRAMHPWPGAYCFLENKRLKIIRAVPLTTDHTVSPAVSPAVAPGTVISGFADELRIAAGSGALSIMEIQSAAGKRLAIGDFLRGHPLAPGTRLS